MRCYFSRNESASFVLEMSENAIFLTNLRSNNAVAKRFLAFERVSRDMLSLRSLSLLFLFPGLGSADLQDPRTFCGIDVSAVFRLQAVNVCSGEAVMLEIAPERPQFLVFQRETLALHVDLAHSAFNLLGHGRVEFYSECHDQERDVRLADSPRHYEPRVSRKAGVVDVKAVSKTVPSIYYSENARSVEFQLLGDDQVVDAAERWIGAASFYYQTYLKCEAEVADKSEKARCSDFSELMRCYDQPLPPPPTGSFGVIGRCRVLDVCTAAQATPQTSSVGTQSTATDAATQIGAYPLSTQQTALLLDYKASPLERNTMFYATRGCQCDGLPAKLPLAEQCPEFPEIQVYFHKSTRRARQSASYPLSNAKPGKEVQDMQAAGLKSTPIQQLSAESQHGCFLGSGNAESCLKSENDAFGNSRSKGQASSQTPCVSPTHSRANGKTCTNAQQSAGGSTTKAKRKPQAGASDANSPTGSPLKRVFLRHPDSPDKQDSRYKNHASAREIKTALRYPAQPDCAEEVSVSQIALQRAFSPEKQGAARRFLGYYHQCLACVKRAVFKATAEFNYKELVLTDPHGKRSVYPVSLAEEGFNFTHNGRAVEFYSIVSQIEQQAARWLVLQRRGGSSGSYTEFSRQEPHDSDYLVYKRAFCIRSEKQWLLLLLTEQDGEAFCSLLSKFY